MLIGAESGSGGGLRRCLRCRKAIEEENARDADEPDDESSDPNGMWRNVVIEEAAKDGGDGAGESPAQPVDGHVATTQVSGGGIGYVFAGNRHEGKFAEGEDDHAEPKAPEAGHEGDTASADGVDEHADADDRQGFVIASQACDKVLDKDTHQRVGGGDPAI